MRSVQSANQVTSVLFFWLISLCASENGGHFPWLPINGQQVISLSNGVLFIGNPLIVFPGAQLGSVVSNQQQFGQKRRVSIQFLKKYLEYYGEEWRRRTRAFVIADWKRQGDLEDKGAEEEQKRASAALQDWINSEWRKNITKFDLSVLDRHPTQQSDDITRLKLFFRKALVIGVNALSPEKFKEWTENLNNMTAIYGSARICPYENQNCNKEIDQTWKLEPDINAIYQNSTRPEDYDKLLYIWVEYRKAAAKPSRPFYIRYIQLLNEGALANRVPGVTNGADLAQRPYFTQNFPQVVKGLLDDVMPFYMELHAFVRNKLRLHYGDDQVEAFEPIPAHLTGSIVAFTFRSVFPTVTPFNVPALNVSSALKSKNFTVRDMFDVSDQLFVSLGLPSLAQGAPKFYQLSRLEPPEGNRRSVCHASPRDFFATDKLPGDFRINMCAIVDQYNFNTASHEMGHIQYYMQYVEQNPTFRDSPHRGFHEGIANFFEQSVRNPKHLESIGLSNGNFAEDQEAQLDFLLQFALDKIPSFPAAYSMDAWRWGIFNGSIPTSRMNAEYWNIRRQFQGIKPPVPRTEDDFDPGAVFHIVFDADLVRYFLASFLQFQFHQALCEASGQFDPSNPGRLPLHLCDVAGSKEAGLKLTRFMEAGSSSPWQDLLFEMTGSREISAEPILTFFKPLRSYIRSYLVENRVPIGWDGKISYLNSDKLTPGSK